MLEKIKEIAADSLGADVSTMTAETSFKEDLGADSLDLFEMVMALEEEFEVEIPNVRLRRLCLSYLLLRFRLAQWLHLCFQTRPVTAAIT